MKKLLAPTFEERLEIRFYTCKTIFLIRRNCHKGLFMYLGALQPYRQQPKHREPFTGTLTERLSPTTSKLVFFPLRLLLPFCFFFPSGYRFRFVAFSVSESIKRDLWGESFFPSVICCIGSSFGKIFWAGFWLGVGVVLAEAGEKGLQLINLYVIQIGVAILCQTMPNSFANRLQILRASDPQRAESINIIRLTFN